MTDDSIMALIEADYADPGDLQVALSYVVACLDAARLGEAEAMALVISHEGHIAKLDAEIARLQAEIEQWRDAHRQLMEDRR
jgi:hypothetical protein